MMMEIANNVVLNVKPVTITMFVILALPDVKTMLPLVLVLTENSNQMKMDNVINVLKNVPLVITHKPVHLVKIVTL